MTCRTNGKVAHPQRTPLQYTRLARRSDEDDLRTLQHAIDERLVKDRLGDLRAVVHEGDDVPVELCSRTCSRRVLSGSQQSLTPQPVSSMRPLLRRESRDEARETCKRERERQREMLASSVTVGSRCCEAAAAATGLSVGLKEKAHAEMSMAGSSSG